MTADPLPKCTLGPKPWRFPVNYSALDASSSVDNDTRLAKTRGPTRTEFNRLRQEVGELTGRQEAAQRELAIQFQRIAELQAEIDLIRAAWSKLRPKTAVKRPRPR